MLAKTLVTYSIIIIIIIIYLYSLKTRSCFYVWSLDMFIFYISKFYSYLVYYVKQNITISLKKTKKMKWLFLRRTPLRSNCKLVNRLLATDLLLQVYDVFWIQN